MSSQLFGKYQLLKKLATGGMAEVWLARQAGIEGFAKNVVIKRILPHLAEDREFVEMFKNEALIAANFNHPNIAQVYEFGEANGTYFRLIGVGADDFHSAEDADPADLADPDAERRRKVEQAMDEVRRKLGGKAIVKGRSLR